MHDYCSNFKGIVSVTIVYLFTVRKHHTNHNLIGSRSRHHDLPMNGSVSVKPIYLVICLVNIFRMGHLLKFNYGV